MALLLCLPVSIFAAPEIGLLKYFSTNIICQIVFKQALRYLPRLKVNLALNFKPRPIQNLDSGDSI